MVNKVKVSFECDKMKVSFECNNVVFKENKAIIEISDEEFLKYIKEKKGYKVRLSTLNPSDIFKIGDDEFIVLEQTDAGTRVISKQLAYIDRSFGRCEDYKPSFVRKLLNGEYYDKISKLVGASNIVPMKRDLTSLDGLDDCGTCTDKITLLSASEYAKYHKAIGLNSNYSNWWWTITPASTPSNSYNRCVCFVTNGGALTWDLCTYRGGVRPFLTLNSSILVDCELS